MRVLGRTSLLIGLLFGSQGFASTAIAQFFNAEIGSPVWADMSTGPASRVFLDTKSISGNANSRSAQAWVIGSSNRSKVTFEFNCSAGQYRIGNSNWQSDDPNGVKRVCADNFKGLQLYTESQIGALPLLRGTVLKTDPGKWILVDWSSNQMVLIDPATIVRNGDGWRANSIYQYAGEDRVQTELFANCAKGSVTGDKPKKADQPTTSDPFTSALSALMRIASPSPVDVVTYWALCHERPSQLYDAPGVDLAAALAARTQFEADRSRYLAQHPGADISHVVTVAPGPKDLGGYQLSLIDIDFPAGINSQVVGAEQRRTLVTERWKPPFSAVGRLLIKFSGNRAAQCTATLVGDNKTILTARHCAGGVEYIFSSWNTPNDTAWKTGIPAKVVAFGDKPVNENNTVRTGVGTSPNPDWDDWMVLDLQTPSRGLPLEIPSKGFIETTIKGFQRPYFHVVGFPGDIRAGDQMTYSRGCGTEISERDYKGLRTSQTSCAAYHGSSGSALLVLTPEHRYVPVGVLTSGDDKDTTFSILTVGDRVFEAIRTKVATECRTKPSGVIFHPKACTSR